MSQQGSTPTWHVSGDPAATIGNALASGVSRERIVSLLAEREFEELPDARIEAIVAAAPDRGTGDEFDLPLSQAPSVDASPREAAARSIAVRDLQYLSRREAGRVVGLALEQFDGNTVRPATNEATEVDLFWRRQHMTVGIRTVPVVDELVDVDHVTAVVDGPLATANVQTPSEVAVVTNGEFTDAAVSEALDDVLLFEAGHVRAWFRRARLPLSAVGTVLEAGENHDGPLSDLVDVVPVPVPRRAIDPLAIEPVRDDITTDSGGSGPSAKPAEEPDSSEADEQREPDPSDEPSPDVGKPPAGQTGTLYADSDDEDDEHEAFDEYLEGL